jgi:transposase
VFAGNRHDSTTVEEVIAAMERKYGRARRVWVMDRGMVSEANLEYLREHGGSYIVGTPKSQLRWFEQHLTEQGWQEAQAGVEVKLVKSPDGSETFILARSADRRQKEQAMHERFRVRMEAALTKLQAAAECGRLREAGVAHQRWGRLKQQYWRVAAAYEVTIEALPHALGKARLRISWRRNDRWSDWATLSEGCYLLRSNLTDMDPATLWKRYIQLTEAEWAFRITKDELRIRPIWHQKEGRVKAHILVCFLAYVLWKTLAEWMQRSGLGDAPRTLIEELANIKSGDVVLPTKSRSGQALQSVRLRCVTTPDEPQRILLNRLGLNLPQRLRRLNETPTM